MWAASAASTTASAAASTVIRACSGAMSRRPSIGTMPRCGWKGPCRTVGPSPRCGTSDGKRPARRKARRRLDEVIASEFDEDSQAREEIPPEKIDAVRGVVRDPDADDATGLADSEGEADDEPPFDAGPPAGPDSAGSSGGVAIRPFANLPKLPDDVQEALESFKLAILAHKLTGWDDVSCDDILAALDG